MRPPRPLDADAVDVPRPGPALGRSQHQHRPLWTLGRPARPRLVLDRGDPVQDLVQSGRHPAVHLHRVLAVEAALHQVRLVAVAAHQVEQLRLRNPGEHGRIGDLVAVQVQDRQHRAVRHRVEELVRVPGGGQRPGLRLAVPDDAGDDQVRVVEGGPVRVHERVAELAALMDRAGRLRRRVAGDPAGEGELPDEPAQPVVVRGDRGVELAVGALQVRRGHHSRAAVARSGHVQGLDVPVDDRPVEVCPEEGQPGGGAPVPEQPRLDVLEPQRLAQQRVVEQVDLPDGQVVGRAPPGVEQSQPVVVRSGTLGCGCGGDAGRHESSRGSGQP